MTGMAAGAMTSTPLFGGTDGTVRTAAADGIVTPEAVLLEVETAGIATRLFAGLIDVLVQIAMLIIGSIFVALMFAGSVFDDDAASTAQTIYFILVFMVILGYPALSETWMRGQTIGKRALGVRAVTVEGAPIRFRHAALRAMGGLVDKLLIPTGIIGLLFVFATRRHQRVGDLLAGTIVIRDPDRSALPMAVWFPVPPGLDGFAAEIDPTAMTTEQYTTVRNFLMRNRQLSADARFTVADDLAGRLADTLRFTNRQRVHPEAFLLCAISRYQRRNFPQYQPTAWQGR